MGQPVNGKNKSHNKIDVIQDIDSVPSNVQSANHEALLYVFEVYMEYILHLIFTNKL